LGKSEKAAQINFSVSGRQRPPNIGSPDRTGAGSEPSTVRGTGSGSAARVSTAGFVTLSPPLSPGAIGFDSPSGRRQAQPKCQNCAIMEKESSSATHVPTGYPFGHTCYAIAETADALRKRTGTRGGRKPPRLVAGPAAGGESKSLGRVINLI
jgi:hypothetical protein